MLRSLRSETRDMVGEGAIEQPLLFVHPFENRTRTQGHPLARLTLLVDIYPGFAVVGIPVLPVSCWLLLTEEPRYCILDPHVFGKAQFTENRDILQDVGHVARGKAEL